jgi:hypothetical protein
MTMDQYRILWPENFEDYAWELEWKGVFAGLELEIEGRIIRPTFFDETRLMQQMSRDLLTNNYFFEPHVIVLERVTRRSIEHVVDQLARSGELSSLVGHPKDDS